MDDERDEEERSNQGNPLEKDMKKKPSSFFKILGGDFFSDVFFKRQYKLILLIVVLTIFYIQNRYACERQQIEIDKLKKELSDAKYLQLSRSSELMERTRQSRIEEYAAQQQSDIETSSNPPYEIEQKDSGNR